MNPHEYTELKKFIDTKIFPRFGKQPSRLCHWNKEALRMLHTEYLKPHYFTIRNNPKFRQLIDEVQRRLEYD